MELSIENLDLLVAVETKLYGFVHREKPSFVWRRRVQWYHITHLLFPYTPQLFSPSNVRSIGWLHFK